MSNWNPESNSYKTMLSSASAIDMLKWDLDTPTLLVDIDQLETNIHEMAATAATKSVGVRPHVKTHKTVQIAKMQVSAGANGLTVAKLGEAEVFAGLDIDTIFVCYTPVGEQKVRRLLALRQQIEVIVGLNDITAAEYLSRAAVHYGVRFKVLLEVDTGLHRTGFTPGSELLAFAQAIDGLRGLEIAGLFTFEGHVYGASTPDELRAWSKEAAFTMVSTAADLRQHGFNTEIISTGSTPSAKHIVTVPGVTEIRPGAYVFYDRMQVAAGVATVDKCAATVLATIVSSPAPDRVIIDAGSKSLTLETLPFSGKSGGYGIVKGHAGWEIEHAAEEISILRRAAGDDPLNPGDKVEIIPNHICPVINLFDEMILIQQEKVVDFWQVAARGRTQ